MVEVKFTTRAANDPVYAVTVGLSGPLKSSLPIEEKSKINKISRKLTKHLAYKVLEILAKNGYSIPLSEDYLVKINGTVSFDYKEVNGDFEVTVNSYNIEISVFKRERTIRVQTSTSVESVEKE
ncbi:MAG TPA: hypothetical protein EYH40_05130 [Desulfurococcales archaeon]|nr:hypothetical protein [Desulfurococcales archaeon]